MLKKDIYSISKTSILALLLISLSQIIVADALIPVTYSCCKDYIINQGTLLDNFENLNDWTLNGLHASYIEADTINFKEGKQGLKLVAKNGDKVYTTRNINSNFSNTKNFVFDVYVYDETTLNYVTVYFTSQKDWSKYFHYTIGKLQNGWNRVVIKRSDMINSGEDDWNNTMIMFRLTSYPIIGKDTSITIDNFRYDMYGRAKLIFNFDDGTIGDLVAEPILTANNQRAVSFIAISWLDHKDFMTLDNLKRLQSLGWDISSHTISHPDLTTLDDNNLTIELNNSYDWFINNDFQKSAGFLAYPFGYYNNNVIAKAKQRYILARGVESGILPHMAPEYRDDLYKLKIIEARNSTPVQLIKDRIDTTIDQGQLIILVFHRIVKNSPSKYEYLESDLKQISDYVKSRSSDIDVLTFSDYLIPNINSFTPVINKTSRIYSNGTVSLISENKYDEYIPNMIIKPLSGSIDIRISTYNEKDDQLILFNESASDPSIKVLYSVGDRIPNQKYSVDIYKNNGTLLKSFYKEADDKGYIRYHSVGFDDPRYTEIRSIAATNKMIVSEDNVKDDEINDDHVINKDNDTNKDIKNNVLLPMTTLSVEHKERITFPIEILAIVFAIILIIYSLVRYGK